MLIVHCLLLLSIASCGLKLSPVAPESVAPEPVKNLHAVSRDGKLLIRFTKPSKNVDGSRLDDLAGFKVMRRVAEDRQGCKTCPDKFPVVYYIDVAYPLGVLVEGDRVVYTDGNVNAGVKYEYKVVAYNKEGYEGPESRRVAFLWAQPPLKPLNLNGKAGDKVVDILWSPSEILPNGSLAGYNIYRREEGKKYPIDPLNLKPLRETKFSDFGLKNDKVYHYTVRALREANESLIEGPSAEEIALTPKEVLMEELKGDR